MENIKMINKIRIKRKEKQLLLRFVTGILIFSILLNVGIAALYPQVVYASFAGTVAGYILTLFASFNCAITNPNVVGAINNTFGSMALEAADAGVIQQGLTQIAQTTGFDMTTIFSNTAAEAAQFAQVAGVEIENVASTAGQNLAAGAAACAAAGGTVLPAIAGTVLPAAAAVGLGVAGGFLIDHIRTSIMNYVKNGASLTTNPTVAAAVPNGVAIVQFTNLNYAYSLLQGNLRICNYHSTNGLCWRTVDGGGFGIGRLILGRNPEWFTIDPSGPSNPNLISNAGIYELSAVGYPVFDTWQEVEEYLLGSNSPNIAHKQNNVSPDIVGNNGNQTGVQDGNDYRLPYVQPIYNYGNTVINYISPSDYQNLVDSANNNTNNGDIGEDTQGEDFDTFVSPYIQPIENQPQEPELPNPQPTISPSNPTIPIQPTPAPEPTLTPEEETEMPKGMIQPSLKDKFPFCIPFDIAYLFAILSDEREAPNFVWTLDLGTWGQYELEIDLTPFDSVASIFRLCELILFILGLMLITKSLLSSNDGG